MTAAVPRGQAPLAGACVGSAGAAPAGRSITGTVRAAPCKDLTDAVVAACADPLCAHVVRAVRVTNGAGTAAARYRLADLPGRSLYVAAFTDTNRNRNRDCSYFGYNDLPSFYSAALDGSATVITPPRTGITITLPF